MSPRSDLPFKGIPGEEQFRAIFETAPECVKLVTRDGCILHMNAAGLSMVEAPSIENVVGQCIYDWIAPEHRAAYREFNERVCSGEKGSLQFDMLSRTGVRCHMETQATPLPDSDGTIVHLAITRNITERKRTELAALLLGAIVDSTDDAILSKDLNGTITSWNQSAERVFGYTAAEAVGRSVAELLIPQDRQDEETEILSRLRRGERVEHFQTRRKRKDGTLIDISVTISPVRDASGTIIGASKIARDITAQVQAQKKLEEANEALKRANADLEHFAYSASHDLQEPLRMVSVYGEMLRRKYNGKLDANADEYIGFLVEGVRRMESLLGDLRAFTRVAVSPKGPPPHTDAQSVLDSALVNLQITIEENQAEVSSAIPLPAVSIPSFQLQQVFQNLIGNAIHYRSAAPPKIHVAAVREGDAWKLSVQDNGIGIAPEYKEQIFELFKRLHIDDHPGSGLGLSICQRIIDRAGGRIWVESEPGKGSTFFFTVPGV